MSPNSEPSSPDVKVLNAVKFIHNLDINMNNSADLRHTSLSKDQLDRLDVDEAVRNYLEIGLNSNNIDMPLTEEKRNKREYKRAVSKRKSNKTRHRETSGKSRHRETNVPESRRSTHRSVETKQAEIAPPVNILSMLVPRQQGTGHQLIKDFLDTEISYCNILECLLEDYYAELSVLADRNKFQMTRSEIDEIFQGIPELLRFHRVFYFDMNQGYRLGHIQGFKLYLSYVKVCAGTIQIMRKYSLDKKLLKHLTNIKQRSRRQDDDMMDLLLVPLDRIFYYKEFMETLYRWSDKTIMETYHVLGKAARCIGGVTMYIERYKFEIFNGNEMNKVQMFLNQDYNLFRPWRKIIRQGPMARRTMGWTGMKKSYIFFLFTDILFWASKSGDVQDAVFLQDCEVIPSDSKKNHKRKLRIVVGGKMPRVLFLECESEHERDEWYTSIRMAAAAAKGGQTNFYSAATHRRGDLGDENQLTVERHRSYSVPNKKKSLNYQQNASAVRKPAKSYVNDIQRNGPIVRKHTAGGPIRNPLEAASGHKTIIRYADVMKNRNCISFLSQSKQIAGRDLIKDFLKSEKEYCNILECLQYDYLVVLWELADEDKISMPRREIDEIFNMVPDLLKNHKALYIDLEQGSRLSTVNFFKMYVEYVKNCSSTVLKMQSYNLDKPFHKCLKRIQQRSRYKQEGMMDLLLAPLNRFILYQEFFDKLHVWSDKAQTVEHEVLGMASRRVNRIANYIDAYRHGICNRNEMNKVQVLLGKQCDILGAKRNITRRGIMTRRGTGWASRNIKFIFFLFSDIFLWTNHKGSLKNAVYLVNCELESPDKLDKSSKRFKMVVQGKTSKPLVLECETQRQRDEWYHLLYIGIHDAKKAAEKELLEEKGSLHLIAKVNDKAEEELKIDFPAKDTSKDLKAMDEQVPDPKVIKATEKHMQVPDRMRAMSLSNSKGDAFKNIISNQNLPSTRKDTTPTYGSNNSKDDDSTRNSGNNSADVANGYEHSLNFKHQEFKEFGPADDILAETSYVDLNVRNERKIPESPRLLQKDQTSDLVSKDDEKNARFSPEVGDTAAASPIGSSPESSSSKTGKDIDIQILNEESDVFKAKEKLIASMKAQAFSLSHQRTSSNILRHNFTPEEKSSPVSSRRSYSTFSLGKLTKEHSLAEPKMLGSLIEEEDDYGIIGSMGKGIFPDNPYRSKSIHKTVQKPEKSANSEHRRRSTSVLVKLNDFD